MRRGWKSRRKTCRLKDKAVPTEFGTGNAIGAFDAERRESPEFQPLSISRCSVGDIACAKTSGHLLS
jgi:hypothetical protein